MAKRLIFIVILILGCSLFTNLNESRATDTGSSASDPGSLNISKHHRNRSPYRIINSRYVVRSSIKRIGSLDNEVRIRIMQNGKDNMEIEDLLFAYDSGMEYRMGNVYGIENVNFPIYVKVTYRSWNTFHAVQSDVIYEFIIYYPGTWNVTICN